MKKKIIITVFLVFWAAVFIFVYRYVNRERAEIKYYRSTDMATEEEF